MLTWLELFLDSTVLCASWIRSTSLEYMPTKQNSNTGKDYLWKTWLLSCRSSFSACLHLGTKTRSVMSLSAAARATADLRIYMILQTNSLSLWILSASFCHWMTELSPSTPYFTFPDSSSWGVCYIPVFLAICLAPIILSLLCQGYFLNEVSAKKSRTAQNCQVLQIVLRILWLKTKKSITLICYIL